MITILSDHDIEGYAFSIIGVLGAEGWLEMVDLRLTTFAEVGLPCNSAEQTGWRFAQAKVLVLLTNNRNMEGEYCLEQTLREENTLTSLLVVTEGKVGRLSGGD